MSHRLAKMQMKRYMTGRWIYPLLDAAIKAVGLEYLDMYVLRLQNTVAHYISNRPILEIFLEAEQCPGSWILMKW